MYECYFAVYDATTRSYSTFAFQENCLPGVDPTLHSLYDTQWSDDMTWTWIKFGGLSLNPQSNVSMQLLVTKVISGLEVQPSTRSAWNPMLKLGPTPDLQAMQALMDAFYLEKHAMPARCNWLGVLGTLATGALSLGSSVLNSYLSKNNETEGQKAVRQAVGAAGAAVGQQVYSAVEKSVHRSKQNAQTIQKIAHEVKVMKQAPPRPPPPTKPRAQRNYRPQPQRRTNPQQKQQGPRRPPPPAPVRQRRNTMA